MSIKFKSNIESEGKIIQSKHRAIKHTDTVQTLEVKVITKTVAHPHYDSGNTSALGYTIDGVEGAYLELTPGITYKFDQSDSSNATHPLRFATAKDAAGSTEYTTGVTTNGTPGNASAYTQIIPTTTTPPILHYYCSAHNNMGSYVKFGTGTVGDTYSINVATDGSNVDLNLDAASGTDSTVQLTAGSNITLTRNDAQQVTIAASGGALTVQDETSTLSTAATTLKFTGTGVTASGTGATKTIDIPGGSGITIQEEGGALTTAATTLNFIGSGVTAAGNGATKTITVSGSSSGGQVTTQINVSGDGTTQATDGSRTQFTITSTPASENNLQIYIDGVYQSKSDFSVSGTTVTLDAAPATGTVLEIIHFVVVNANIFLQTHTTANNSTTSFDSGGTISSENDTQVYIDGVYQSKSNYSVSGSNVVLSTAPATGAVVEIVNIRATSGDNDTDVEWQGTVKTSNFTAEASKGYFVNTTSGTVTVSLPAGTSGNEIHFTDYASNFDSNAIIFDANGSEKIQGSTTNRQCITKNATVRLIYQDATKGWTANNLMTPPVTVNYLVLAGGGAGGGFYRAGGGGAGGLRTSYGSTSGGGASAESALTLNAETDYTVTVGGGGASTNANSANTGGNGSNSILATITSIGGGGGGRYTSSTGTAGAAGGSGGGGGGDSTGGAGGAGTANQGYAGGAGAGGGVQCGGGGGGAGAVGQVGGGGATSGDGGDGIQSAILNYANAGTASVGEQISGSQVWYAGGGGGGSYSSGNDTIPGKGGGGEGTSPSEYSSTQYYGHPGTANTGGGGGGASGEGSNSGGGAGGSGVVILRYPSSNTLNVGSGLTQSSGSPFTEGSDKISVFTAGTGNISFL